MKQQVILLVEDNFDAVPFAIAALMSKYKVDTRDNTLIIVHDYDEALEALDTHPEITIVVTDLFFPKKTGSEDISLGISLLDEAEARGNDHYTRNCIKEARESMHKNPGDQGLGFLVAKKAKEMGKITLVVSNIHHHHGPFQAILELLRSHEIPYCDGLKEHYRGLVYGFKWKIQKINPEAEAEGDIISKLIKTQLTFWDDAIDKLVKLTNPS